MPESKNKIPKYTVAERFNDAAQTAVILAWICCSGISAAIKNGLKEKRRFKLEKAAYAQQAKGYLEGVEVMFTDEELDDWRS